jgi:hypothetical protein
MLIEEVDGFDFEPLEGAFDCLLNVIRLAIEARRSGPVIAATEIESELGGDHNFATVRSESFAYKLFVGEWAVDFGGVKEGDAAVDGGVKKSGHLLLVFGRTVGKAHSHAPQAESRNFQVAASKFALLH